MRLTDICSAMMLSFRCSPGLGLPLTIASRSISTISARSVLGCILSNNWSPVGRVLCVVYVGEAGAYSMMYASILYIICYGIVALSILESGLSALQLVPHQSGFDKLYKAYMVTSFGIFYRGDLPLTGTCGQIIVTGY